MTLPATPASLRAAFVWMAAWLCSLAAFTGISRAADTQLTADEYSLKAAFLFNLAKFVEWPPGKLKADHAPLIIGVTGKEPFERVSATLREKAIDTHNVVVRLLTGEDQIQSCHILFLTRSQKEQVLEMVNAAHQAGVLTAGETDDFLDSGGMIRFYLVSGSVRLEIANDSVRHAGLTIKANALATLINKGIAKLRKM